MIYIESFTYNYHHIGVRRKHHHYLHHRNNVYTTSTTILLQNHNNNIIKNNDNHNHDKNNNKKEKISIQRLLKNRNKSTKKIESNIQNTTILTNTIPTLIALSIPISVILSLAMNNNDNTIITTTSSSSLSLSSLSSSITTTNNNIENIDTIILEGLEVLEESIETLENLGSNILDAALPQDATDLLSIVLGEGIAGVIGAGATWGVNLGIKVGTQLRNDNSNNNNNIVMAIRNDVSNNSEDSKGSNSNANGDNISWIQKNVNNILGTTGGPTSDRKTVDILFNEALADSDYFLTRAAASPLIGAIGMSGGLASALTVLLASVPYQFIKFSARARDQKIKEDLYFNALLLEEQERQNKASWFSPRKNSIPKMNDDESIMEMDDPLFDFVEIFTDLCKWLEYDVLMNDFGGKLRWAATGIPINPGVESAAFGFLAALSSQIYADIIYSVSDSIGTDAKRTEVRTRTINDYIRLYAVKCLSAATLFGVYESTRIPVTKVINNFLSGGYDSCLGSDDFDFCLQTYLFENPAEATPEAQLRSFAVAFINLFDRFSDITNENVDTAGLVRSLAVQLYSLISFDLPVTYSSM